MKNVVCSTLTKTQLEELKAAKKQAVSAVRDFMYYHTAGYDQQLIDNIKAAKTESEIRDLLRKARAAS